MQDRIIGTTMPVLEVTLEPGETLVAEAGELSWMTDSIQMATAANYAGGGGIGGMLKRAVGGGTIFMTQYTAQGYAGTVAFAARIPGQIAPIDLDGTNGYLCQRHAFVCCVPGVQLTVGFQKSFSGGFFSGTGFVLQRVQGAGRAWFDLSGEIVPHDLAPGESLRVHPSHIGLFQDTVQFSIAAIPGIRNKLFGREGMYLAQLTGPGRVWLQSMSLERLAQVIEEYAEHSKGKNSNSQSQ